ncbi:GatB/YqeY domain-containing protein [Niabella beijingensis]|uniref:GatB/YqeY domain-containing protein n=1 Tax=Niabella beijingensis TaxID=2872700 RepID=UPI001CBF1AC6|nr:GatB/YqeY domain-containing protein [Niabella beijingensis]MBZ4189765.1 GatB/YqeY domain-containing protein [Niabella beijingensis]
MSLEQTINEDIKKAMLGKEEVALRSLRAIKAAILLAKTAEGAKDQLSAYDEIKLVQKLVKQRKDSLEIFEKQNRPDLAQKEKEEIEVLERYLPAQLSEAELRPIIAGFIEQTGASGPADMGKVMGLASKELAGKAEGKTIAALVKELLAK